MKAINESIYNIKEEQVNCLLNALSYVIARVLINIVIDEDDCYLDVTEVHRILKKFNETIIELINKESGIYSNER